MPTIIIHRPTGRLAQVVEVIVLNAGFTFPHQREVFLPDGGVDLVIDLGHSPKKLYHDVVGDAHTAFRHGWFSGMRSGRFIIDSGNGSPMLVLSGEPPNEPYVNYGPFVMNTEEEIHQAIEDYKAGKFGVLAD